MASIIEMDHVSFSYGQDAARALDDITLAIEEGSFVGVIGPSGAGKSTLASVLSGAIPHHYTGQLFGATRVDGRDTCEVTLTDISQVVGSVLQDIDAQMVASGVEDEMLFGLENFGVPHDQIETRITEALAAVDIEALRDREIATLSGGQKQKVAIAAILALKPRVLVLDEPTAALDPVSSRNVFETLREVNRSAHVTVVVIEQAVALLSEFCDRVLVLNHGHVALDGEPHDVFSHGEELRAIGVDSPRVARIFNSLAETGLVRDGKPCLSVDEATSLVSDIVGSGHAAAPADEAAQRPSPHAPATRPHAEGSEPILTFRDVCFAYPGGGASVDNLDMTVYPGELVAIVGQNGAGKTTATKLLNGLLKPASGEVRIAGLNTREVPVSQIARHVSTLFQNPDRQLCRDTVLDEVAFSLELQGVEEDEARKQAGAVIERFGLPADEAPFSLSRGQRQMVALASVVVTSPQVIVLDEPTSGLDYRECMTVMETVREQAERGCSVIMVCHDMEVVSDFAERVVVMANGRILDRGPARDMFADRELMREASITPPQVIDLSERLAASCSPAFSGISEVSGIVETVKELAHA